MWACMVAGGHLLSQEAMRGGERSDERMDGGRKPLGAMRDDVG